MYKTYNGTRIDKTLRITKEQVEEAVSNRACPTCKAEVGKGCSAFGVKEVMVGVHKSRLINNKT